MNPSKQIEQQLQIDRACDAFETDLKVGRGSELSDYIPVDLDIAAKDELLEHLLSLELEYRSKAGEAVSKDDYLARYPQQQVVIERVFSSVAGGTWFSQASQDTRDAPPTDQPEELVGKTVGPYALLNVAGYGGMGVVYLAKHEQTGRKAALKLIRPWDGLDPSRARERLDRFLTEIEVASNLDHPHIVPVYEVGEHQSRPFFAMRLVDGADLSRCVGERSLDARKAASVMADIADAVQYAHQRSVLHRDIKPSNILLSEKGQAYLTDFGIAKVRREETDLTSEQSFLGSLAFMSPEQTCNPAAVGPASDVYSLGATLYYLLCGQPPFPSTQDPFLTIRQINEVDPPPPRKLDAGSDLRLQAICMKCLQKQESQRYSSAGALRDDLRRYLNGEPILAKPVTRLQRMRLWMARNRLATGAGFMALLLVIVAASSPFVFSELSESRRAEKRQRVLDLVDDGDWKATLDYIESTDGFLNSPRSVDTELARFRSLEALGRTRESYKVVEALGKRADLGPHRTTVLALNVSRLYMTGNQELALKKAKVVVGDGATGIEAEFAKAFLAVKPKVAIQSLEQAAKDWSHPLHHSASQLLISCYILSGRRQDAEQQCQLMKTLYPHNSAPYIAEAWMHSIEGDLASAKATLRACPSKLSDDELEQAIRFLRIWTQLNEYCEQWRNGSFQFQALQNLGTNFAEAQAEMDSPTIQLLPCYVGAYSQVLAAMGQWVDPKVGVQAAIQKMKEVTETHQESTLEFVLGVMQFTSSNNLNGEEKIQSWRDAAESFERALASPASLPEIDTQARLASGVCHHVVFMFSQDEETLRVKALQRYKEFRRIKKRFPADTLFILISGIQAFDDPQLLTAVVQDAAFDDAAKGGTNHMDHLLGKAKTLAEQNQTESAARILRQMINVDPNHKAARDELKALPEAE